MEFCFDRVIDRANTQSVSTDGFRASMFPDRPDLCLPVADADVSRLWVADMDFAAPPCVLDALHKRVEHGIFGYTQIFSDTYPNAFSAWCEKMYGWTFAREHLCYSHGIVSALNDLVKMLCTPKDNVLFFTPSYGPFARAAKNAGCEFVCSDLVCDESGLFTIDFDDFASKAADPDTRVCIFCNPHNPTGRLWTKEELKRVGEICLQNGLTLISDEIHCDLLRSGKTHTPFASLFPDETNIITCMAPSKTFNIAGLQFSNIIIPNAELREAWQKTHSESENPLSITAAEAAYTGGYDWLMALREYLDGNFRFAADYFAANSPKVRFRIPEATYLAWADFGSYFDGSCDIDAIFAERGGVLLESGATFVQNARSFVRINIACPRELLETGLSRICKVLNSL